jgi:PAS domain S-box-containing protein
MIQPISLLMIDDNPADTDLIRDTLPPDADFTFHGADRLSRAIDLLKTEDIDVVLLDLGLPDSNGIDTLARFREVAPDIPVVVLTGNDDPELAMEALRTGAEDYLVKGAIDPHLLARTVRYARERKRFEQNLRESEQRFRSLVACSVDHIFMLDLEGRFAESNGATEHMGFPADHDIVGKTLEDVYAPEVARLYRLNLDQVISTRQPLRFDHHLDRKIDERVHTDTLYPVLLGEQLRGIGGICHDITERKKAEDRVAHLNQILRAIRDINQLIVREKDAQNLIRETSRLLVVHRGYNAAMIVLTGDDGLPVSYAEAGMGEAFGPLEENLKKGILPPCCDQAKFQNGAFYVNDRVAVCARCPIADGCAVNDVLCVRLKNDLRTYGYLAVAMDRAKGIDAEEKALFDEMADDVSHALHHIYREKIMVSERAEKEKMEAALRQAQKMDAIGRLAGGMAHDFNNMLSIILGCVEMAISEISPEHPIHYELSEIIKAGQRSAGLIRQLLAFSRKQIVDPREVDLNRAVAEQFKMLGRLVGEDIRMEFHPGHELWPIRIDPSQLDQIMVNLAANSRDAISGIGKISVATANTSADRDPGLQQPYVSPGEYVMLAFSDTGCGMDEKTLEHIFEPFFSTKEVGKGTGLGLSTIYGIVKQNKGYIQVYSTPKEGATVKIYFPKVETAGQTVDEKMPAESVSGTETVLIVEDQPQLLKLARKILEHYGYHVLTAGSPSDALEICKTYQGDIHLLLTDVIMPDMNGKDLHLKVADIRPDIGTLFMSGYPESAITERGILKEGFAFIQKPFSVKILARKVREVLEQKPEKS